MGSLFTAEACKPPLCAKADAPTYGAFLFEDRFKISSCKRDKSVNNFKFSTEIVKSKLSLKYGFNNSVGIIETKLALPHLSPKPLIVPCTCLTPA